MYENPAADIENITWASLTSIHFSEC
ncbi:TPA: hypothetical protein ANIA_11669 [Aspergillus nidulans FGSC A4]|uniref:Uncharacterized protein n=1 Tax=Emericella nidulans (strain FGSC A4 / ATCC 38163 / CBS 112.46 / NRRL 194 / M139) TaxID=227321 RepID=C8VJH4_EMENI|nr:TPA: hypothetical protein ANIA_11669 [Aspergillus nidulans FGSC A4]